MDSSTQIAEFVTDQLCDSVTVWLKPLKDQSPNSVKLINCSIMIYDISSSGYSLQKLKTNFAKFVGLFYSSAKY